MPTRKLILWTVMALVGCADGLGVPRDIDDMDEIDDTEAFQSASRDVALEFATDLKTQLVSALADGGSVHAVGVCAQVAPRIAAQHSEAGELQVGRTSLRVRNSANAPDAWERKVLLAFEQRKQSGERLSELEFTERVSEKGQTYDRFMKAIPTGGLCLTCHGANLDPALVQTLDALYPEDQARGFETGDIRGAFSIRQIR